MESDSYRLPGLPVVAIIGSRDWTDRFAVNAVVRSLAAANPDTAIASGRARGVDSFARQAALENNLQPIDVPAEWDTFGMSAGFKRNRWIARISDVVIAFWDGQSKGTANTLKHAYSLNKKTLIISPEIKNPVFEVERWIEHTFGSSD